MSAQVKIRVTLLMSSIRTIRKRLYLHSTKRISNRLPPHATRDHQYRSHLSFLLRNSYCSDTSRQKLVLQKYFSTPQFLAHTKDAFRYLKREMERRGRHRIRRNCIKKT